MKTRILTICIALFASIQLYAFTIDNLSYQILGGDSVAVSQSYMTVDATTGDIIIPETITYNDITYRVVKVRSFFACQGITSVSLPNTITTIESAAFSGCTSMASVNIPNSVITIEESAFRDCSSLSSIIIGTNVKTIGEKAFRNCSNIGSITIGDSVKSIGTEAFWGCTNLSSIEWNAKNCENYAKKTLGLGYSTPFGANSSISLFVIGEGVEIIPTALCQDMTNINSILIPNSVTKIGESAFSNCSGLTSVSIGTNVDSIGKKAFESCNNVVSVIWNAINCADFEDSNSSPFYASTNSITSFILGNSVEHIPAYLCYNLKKITSVDLPNNLKTIGKWAFYYCSSPATLIIPNSVTTIGDGAFCGWKGITSLDIPNSVSSIGASAFGDCSNMVSVHIPDSLSYISAHVFRNCTSLASITIPDSVSEIGAYTFGNCKSLTSIVFPDNLKKIYDRAFYSCSGLRQIDMGFGLKHIGQQAFATCNSLTDVIIGDSVEYIGSGAFAECIFLSSVTMPSSIINIENEPFWHSSRLHSIYVPCGEMERFKQMLPYDSTKVKYKPTPFTITVKCEEEFNGQYYLGGGIVEYPDNITTCDSLVQILAIPMPDCYFKQWSDGVTDNPRSIELTQDTTLIAEFSIITYTLSLFCNENHGSVAGSGIYIMGNSALISATPNEGYEFDHWSDDNTENPREIIVDADIELTAYFRSLVGTDIEDAYTNDITPHKVLQDGQIFILRGNKTYTITGAEVR